ncbi:hypothetical protein B0H17DRAFT_1200988 [Mycena rosella]|uniref:FCP1 homology domain-containing protein n=1 Tax=Mycena rosella TaxID=1033263 RepID=A0AAD7DHS7_MYCRO|nr:hypothetical protein B0H17DRAFT_1200988 [Mycena rosella]
MYAMTDLAVIRAATAHPHNPPQNTLPPHHFSSPQLTALPDQCKFLIFDLNSTLLLCSPCSYISQRKIYLHPYACILVAYIAHPAVYEWLDHMVWSSAQTHNICEMVEHVFSTNEGEGKAHPAGGVGSDGMHSPPQTRRYKRQKTSQNRGPSSLPSKFCVHPPPCHVHPHIQPPLLPAATPFFIRISAGQQLHGAPAPLHGPETTLLIDNLPLKACLQPWNISVLPRRYNGARPVNTTHDPMHDLATAPGEEVAVAASINLGKDRWRKR